MRKLYLTIFILCSLNLVNCGGDQSDDPSTSGGGDLVKASEVSAGLIDGSLTERWVFKSRTVSKDGESVTVTDCQSPATQKQFTDVFGSDGINMNAEIRSFDYEFEPDGDQIDRQRVIWTERACFPQLARMGSGYDVEEIDDNLIMFKPVVGLANMLISKSDITDREIKLTYKGVKLAYGTQWYEKYTIVYTFTRTKFD